MVTATTSSTTTNIAASGDNRIDSLILGGKWGGVLGSAAIIDYSFPGVGSQWSTTYGGDYSFYNEPTGIVAFDADQQTAFRTILQSFSDVANITFNEVVEDNTVGGSVGDIRIAYSDVLIPTPAIGWAYGPFNLPVAGDIWMESTFTDATEGSLDVHVLAHELGHALGLAHPFLDDEGNASSLSGDVLPLDVESNEYSIMSYYPGENYGDYYVAGPQLYDILTLQYLYGVNTTYNTGADAYTFSNSSMTIKSLWDAGGTDTLSAANQTLGATINLTAGSFSSIGLNNVGGAAVNNISIAFGAVIENATGSNYADTLTGNDVANKLFGKGGGDTLNGGAGNDVLNGGGGSDTMYGGTGDDLYYVDTATDTVIEGTNAGTDIVYSTVSHTLSSNVEQLVLQGSAGLSGTGNGADNLIIGNKGANGIKGGSGNDTLKGYGGNDTLKGNGGNDTLKGNGGNDSLYGGIGSDAMYGGTGDDSYYVDAATDTVVEGANAGTDIVYSTVSHTLSVNVEQLVLQGSAGLSGTGNGADNLIIGNKGANSIKGGSGNDTLKGNDGNDTLKGNGGNDTLKGNGGNDSLYGGIGSDTMYGGTGDDSYYIDAATDTVIEGTNAGTDIVYSTVSHTLSINVEQLVLQGSANLSGTGNGADNLIIGNKGANNIIGGSGNDILMGNGGNDTLKGYDGNDTLKGNGDNDTLKGNGGNDTLNGGGGVDQLYGGKGMDVFEFNALADVGDVIHDFNAAGGEYLKVGTLLSSLGWGGGDAVADGWLSLVQNGANVDVMLDVNGGGDALDTVMATITTDTVAGLGAGWWLA